LLAGMNVVAPLVVSTFGVVFVAELPDKTALASLILATRYPARQVVVGAWLAFLVQTAVAVAAGSVLQLLPTEPVRVVAGLSFLVFAVLALRRKQADREPPRVRARTPPWIASFLVVFVAEWGDLTQLASAALVAMTGQPLSVAIGAVAALWLVTVLAAVAGARLARMLAPTLLNRASAALLAAVGVFVLASAARP
jgi:putative Ca2+/H+ antiporter (TMEM165/GDT1 family)